MVRGNQYVVFTYVNTYTIIGSDDQGETMFGIYNSHCVEPYYAPQEPQIKWTMQSTIRVNKFDKLTPPANTIKHKESIERAYTPLIPARISHESYGNTKNVFYH